MSKVSIYKQLKSDNKYVDYKSNEEFDYRFELEKIEDYTKRNLRNMLLRSFITVYNSGGRDEIVFPKTDYPLSAYINTFVNSIRAMVSSSTLDKKWIETFVSAILLNSETKEYIQMALSLGEYYLEDNLVDEIAEVYSKSGDYIQYAIGIIKRKENYNEFLFDIIKESEGTIRLTAAENIEEINMDITRYMIMEGCKDDYYDEFLSVLVFNSFNCEAFLRNDNISVEESDAFAKLFADVYRILGPGPIANRFPLMDALIEVVISKCRGIYALYDIFAVRDTIIQARGDEIDKEEFIKEIRKFMDVPKFKKALKEGIRDTIGNYGDMAIMADELEIDYTFSDIKKYIKKAEEDSAECEIYSEIMKSGRTAHKIDLIRYIDENNNFDDIIGDLQGITLDKDVELLHSEEIMMSALDNIHTIYPEGRKLLLNAAVANKAKIRIKASREIRKIKRTLDEYDIERLKSVYTIEVIPDIKEVYKSIISGEYNDESERVSIKKEKVETHIRDIYLITSEIRGMKYRDEKIIEKELSSNTIFYMKRDSLNRYDENAIKIVAGDGNVMGYVPKKDNEIISKLMDAGKYFYAILKEYDIENNYAKVDIYMSYMDIIDAAKDVISVVRDIDTRSRFVN